MYKPDSPATSPLNMLRFSLAQQPMILVFHWHISAPGIYASRMGKLRNYTCDDEPYQAALTRAKTEGTSLSALIASWVGIYGKGQDVVTSYMPEAQPVYTAEPVTPADVKAAASAARKLQKALDAAGTGRKIPAAKPGLHACCKHCTHAASVAGHLDPCKAGCS